MACCCGPSCSRCPMPAMQVDVNITVPSGTPFCNSGLVIARSVVLLPTNTCPNCAGRYGYETQEDGLYVLGMEWPCNKPADPPTFTVFINVRWTSDSGTCVNAAGNGGVTNGGGPALIGHPCTTPPGGSICCLNGTKTYDYLSPLGVKFGTFTVTFL